MKIYAYIDNSPFAESVWMHAVWVAQKLDIPIEIVHVLDDAVSVSSGDYSGHHWLDNQQAAIEERVRLDEQQSSESIREGRKLLDDVANQIRKAGIAQVSQRLFQGAMHEHLQQHAAECLVAIIGKQGEQSHKKAANLGSNVEQLVRSGQRPVLIVPREFVPIDRAVIAWDGGVSSGKAINLLANRPLLHGIPTTIVNVPSPERIRTGSLNDARDHLKASGMDVDILIEEGDVEDSILKSVSERDAQLLVIGAYGHSRIRRWIVGSTTTHILKRSESAILVFN